MVYYYLLSEKEAELRTYTQYLSTKYLELCLITRSPGSVLELYKHLPPRNLFVLDRLFVWFFFVPLDNFSLIWTGEELQILTYALNS